MHRTHRTHRPRVFASCLPACAVTLSVLGVSVVFGETPARASPRFSEFFYDAVGSDIGLGFVELYGSPGELLDGIAIEGINGTNGAVVTRIELSGPILQDGLFVVADVDGDGNSSVAADLFANFDFQHGPDSIVLRRDGEILDALAYGVFELGEFPMGEGAPAEDGPAGTSLARVFANIDTDDNAVDFHLLETPTPGTASVLPVPEPGAALISGVGLALIAALRARAEAPATRS